ncbi:MAG: DUF4395 domain-containing protein [Anaerolineales bacterium]
MTELRPVDHALLKLNQVTIILLNLAAFIFNLPALAALTALTMLAGAALGKPFFALALRPILRPRPDVLPDNPEPHRFAQGLGGVFMLGGTLALFGGLSVLGWGLTWLVTALAALNAFGGFCAGCFVYYWLTRLGVPGFVKTPPAGTTPGFRPKAG